MHIWYLKACREPWWEELRLFGVCIKMLSGGGTGRRRWLGLTTGPDLSYTITLGLAVF